MAGISFIATLVTRFFQILFAVVVLGLSVTMVKWQGVGDPPATSEYGAFSGGFALLVGLIGIATIFIEAIPGLISVAADALAAIFTLAAGIAYTVSLKGVDCSKQFSASDKALLNGGCIDTKDLGRICDYDDANDIEGRCKKAEADYVFMFLTFALSAALVALGLLTKGRRGDRGIV
ncbi:MAG: hypothetical protein M1820_006235 [Bogoriella megaspora]|nr:MAG: hypothetical protein M1820_006235 [Bogoriella megaspora]